MICVSTYIGILWKPRVREKKRFVISKGDTKARVIKSRRTARYRKTICRFKYFTFLHKNYPLLSINDNKSRI